mgnify:CR=1 FL=1
MPDSAPVIRPLDHSHAQAMADILNPIIRAGGSTAYKTEFTAQTLTGYVFERATLICAHGAFDGQGALAGFQWLDAADDPAQPTTYIATFARMEPKLRGIGTALITVTKTAAREAGMADIIATIRADNVSGLAYYGKMGFVDHSVTRAVPLADGTPVDRISKRLVL